MELLTGEQISDCCSWRGLWNFEKGSISVKLKEQFAPGLELPGMLQPTDLAGCVTSRAAMEFGLAQGTPVYVGLNDFYAGLLGMGIIREGDMFDISGTSEHVGVISREVLPTDMVSGPYLRHCVTYGGTKASGVSCDFGRRELYAGDWNTEEILKSQPPIFLPYLRGERAPIFNEDARGVFFGIHDRTDRKQMGYSVLEGVVFSIYDIASRLTMDTNGVLICGGGSSVNPCMTMLKAELFDMEIRTVSEPDTSALGAAMTAMVGAGVFSDYEEACREAVHYTQSVYPTGVCRELLLERFGLYRRVYESLREEFHYFSRMEERKV